MQRDPEDNTLVAQAKAGDYVDGDTDLATCEELEGHLEGCNPCQVVVDSIRKAIRLYNDEGVVEIPIQFRHKLRRTLREKWDEKRGR